MTEPTKFTKNELRVFYLIYILSWVFIYIAIRYDAGLWCVIGVILQIISLPPMEDNWYREYMRS